MIFFEPETDKQLANFDIPGERFACVAAAAQRAGQPVDKFLEHGIGEMILQMETRASDSVTLVFTGPDGSECERVELPAVLFEAVQTAARRLGISMPEFVKQSLCGELERELPRPLGGLRWPRAGAVAAGKGGAR